MAAEIVSKAEFAGLVKRDPAFVSRAISQGRIHGDALVGEGRGARIRVAAALQQLGRSLDLGQQMAQAAPILPVATGSDAGGLPLEATDKPANRGQFDGLREESLELKNRRQRLEVERIEREQLRLAGELVRAADVAAELRRQLQPLVATFDEVPSVIAKAISEQFGLPYAEVLIAVKGALRTQRDAWAARARMVGQGAEVAA
jgi:hypothetical protein